MVLAAAKSFSRARLCATPWTAAHQAPLSMGFSRQEYWSGVPLLSPESWFSLAQLQFNQLDSTCASLGLKWRAVAPWGLLFSWQVTKVQKPSDTGQADVRMMLMLSLSIIPLAKAKQKASPTLVDQGRTLYSRTRKDSICQKQFKLSCLGSTLAWLQKFCSYFVTLINLYQIIIV